MQSRRFTNRQFRFYPASALAGGALLLALSGTAQAQTTRSRPQPAEPSHSLNTGGNTHTNSSHPSRSSSNDHKYSGRTESGNWGSYRSGGAVSSGSRVSNKTLSPVAKPSVVKSVPAAGATRAGRPYGVILLGGDIFGGIAFPRLPEDPDPNSDSADNGKTGTDNSYRNKVGTASTGNVKNGTDNTTSLERYKASQEATAANSKSQVYYPDKNSSPFWAYSVDEVLWFPTDIVYASSDGNVLYPTPGGIILGWPNYDPKVSVPRDEPPSNYRIGEKAQPRRAVDLDPTLDDIQRAFQEEHPRLLGAHLQRADRLAFNAPGAARELVTVDLLLERLNALFATRETITTEFDEPEQLDSDLFAVTAWHVYRDRVTMTVYRAKIRLVLQAQGNRVILTAFEMD
ncbi:MAG: hypothetical protein JWL77_1478 [Chthonomonadaceae bacterium]|nr:hypothetical protein [Chthonomonadaceae bacterium]